MLLAIWNLVLRLGEELAISIPHAKDYSRTTLTENLVLGVGVGRGERKGAGAALGQGHTAAGPVSSLLTKP